MCRYADLQASDEALAERGMRQLLFCFKDIGPPPLDGVPEEISISGGPILDVPCRAWRARWRIMARFMKWDGGAGGGRGLRNSASVPEMGLPGWIPAGF